MDDESQIAGGQYICMNQFYSDAMQARR
jgi:hypothetical protein